MDRILAWLYGKLEVEKAKLEAFGLGKIATPDMEKVIECIIRKKLIEELIEDWKKLNNLE